MLSLWVVLILLVQFVNGGNEDKNIFILAGQSNMSGRGGVNGKNWDGIVPKECEPNPSILRFSAGLQWEEAHEPLHKDIDVYATVGIGPGLSFANGLKSLDSNIGVIGLVPCAIGGTKITQWSRGTEFYNELIKRSKASLSEGGNIRAILWYQGESDTILKSDADGYENHLRRLIVDLRRDLQLPNLPFIQVGLATAQGPYKEIVRKAQQAVNIANVWYVDAKGLQASSDYVHLTTAAEATLGQMLAKSFFQHQHNRS